MTRAGAGPPPERREPGATNPGPNSIAVNDSLILPLDPTVGDEQLTRLCELDDLYVGTAGRAIGNAYAARAQLVGHLGDKDAVEEAPLSLRLDLQSQVDRTVGDVWEQWLGWSA